MQNKGFNKITDEHKIKTVNAFIEAVKNGTGKLQAAKNAGHHITAIAPWVSRFNPEAFKLLFGNTAYKNHGATQFEKPVKEEKTRKKREPKLHVVDLDEVEKNHKSKKAQKVVVLIGEPESVRDMLKSALEGMN